MKRSILVAVLTVTIVFAFATMANAAMSSSTTADGINEMTTWYDWTPSIELGPDKVVPVGQSVTATFTVTAHPEPIDETVNTGFSGATTVTNTGDSVLTGLTCNPVVWVRYPGGEWSVYTTLYLDGAPDALAPSESATLPFLYNITPPTIAEKKIVMTWAASNGDTSISESTFSVPVEMTWTEYDRFANITDVAFDTPPGFTAVDNFTSQNISGGEYVYEVTWTNQSANSGISSASATASLQEQDTGRVIQATDTCNLDSGSIVEPRTATYWSQHLGELPLPIRIGTEEGTHTFYVTTATRAGAILRYNGGDPLRKLAREQLSARANEKIDVEVPSKAAITMTNADVLFAKHYLGSLLSNSESKDAKYYTRILTYFSGGRLY